MGQATWWHSRAWRSDGSFDVDVEVPDVDVAALAAAESIAATAVDGERVVSTRFVLFVVLMLLIAGDDDVPNAGTLPMDARPPAAGSGRDGYESSHFWCALLQAILLCRFSGAHDRRAGLITWTSHSGEPWRVNSAVRQTRPSRVYAAVSQLSFSERRAQVCFSGGREQHELCHLSRKRCRMLFSRARKQAP